MLSRASRGCQDFYIADSGHPSDRSYMPAIAPFTCTLSQVLSLCGRSPRLMQATHPRLRYGSVPREITAAHLTHFCDKYTLHSNGRQVGRTSGWSCIIALAGRRPDSAWEPVKSGQRENFPRSNHQVFNRYFWTTCLNSASHPRVLIQWGMYIMSSQVHAVEAKLNGEWSQTETEFTDRSIHCVDCGEDFIWTAGEQVFFHDKGLKNEPKRCKPCKQAKNERLAAIAAAQAAGVRQRIEVSVNCAQCGQQTTVPFYPSQGRPVFCRSCFLAGRGAEA